MDQPEQPSAGRRKTMKRQSGKGWVLIFLALTLVMTAAGGAVAQPASVSSGGPVLNRILQKGELVVGMAGDIPPFSMRSKEGEIIGLDADLATEMAAAMGVKVRIAVTPFAELLPALEKGSVDLVLSGLTITPERNLKFAFVGPYLISGQGILTKRPKLAAMRNPLTINTPKTTLAALKGSTGEIYVRQSIPKAKLVATANVDEAVDLVLHDKVDALITDYPLCTVAVFRHPNRGLASLMTPLTYEPLGIALPAWDPLLVNWMENFLRNLEGSGKLKAMKSRWFDDSTWLSRLP
jgi:polar amino acid transport system substrate-binding protein